LGTLEQDLSRHVIIGVDTAPFIYLWERHPHYLSLSETLFRHLNRPEVQGITSVITLIEVCVHPQRLGRRDLVQTYERALVHSQQVQMVPIDAPLARQASALRAVYNIRVPDALQVGAAIEAGATLFVTNDQRLAKVREIRVSVLEDYLS
jgi:predicted nucleic acid-binding protein